MNVCLSLHNITLLFLLVFSIFIVYMMYRKIVVLEAALQKLLTEQDNKKEV